MNRIVVKIGSNILTESTGRLNYKRIHAIAHDVSLICHIGYQVVIVSSGAIAAGMDKLGLTEKPKEIVLKQAAAAAGQSSLMRAYERSFGRHNKKVAQVLLTRGVVSFRPTYLNSRNTLNALLSFGLVPIVNENDTVAVEEIKLGDNDNLSAMVANLIEDYVTWLHLIPFWLNGLPHFRRGATTSTNLSKETPPFIRMAALSPAVAASRLLAQHFQIGAHACWIP